MRLLKWIGIGLSSLLIVLCLVALVLPERFQVEESVLIDAPPERIMPRIARLREWEHWVGWQQSDPAFKMSFRGPERGPGAVMEWNSPGTNGVFTVTELREPEHMRFEVSMEDGRGASQGSFRLEPTAGGTRVVWRDEGTIGDFFLLRLFIPLMNSSLGRAYALGLQNLKAAVEAEKANGK